MLFNDFSPPTATIASLKEEQEADIKQPTDRVEVSPVLIKLQVLLDHIRRNRSFWLFHTLCCSSVGTRLAADDRPPSGLHELPDLRLIPGHQNVFCEPPLGPSRTLPSLDHRNLPPGRKNVWLVTEECLRGFFTMIVTHQARTKKLTVQITQGTGRTTTTHRLHSQPFLKVTNQDFKLCDTLLCQLFPLFIV